MKRLLLLLGLIFCAFCTNRAHAATCTTLSSGASESTIASAISSCGSGNTVAFGAGTYTIGTSTITIPCGVSLSGPVVSYSQTPTQTATLNGSSSSSGFGFQTTAGCSASQTIQYLAWNGEQPSDGGGFLNIVPGTTNLTVQDNWLHGVNSPGPGYSTLGGGGGVSSLILFSGSGTTVTSNVVIQWNRLGNTVFSDCATAMNNTSSSEDDNGGGCNGVGISNDVANISILNNIFQYLEEPIKTYESGQTGSCNNVIVNYNSISFASRISYETQCYTPGPVKMYIDYNYWGPRYSTNVQSYAISAANGCGNSLSSTCETHTDYNVIIENSTSSLDTGVEIWGESSTSGAGTVPNTTANYNLIQGYMYNGIDWSTSGNFQFNYNNFNTVLTTGGSPNCQTDTSGAPWNHETGNPNAYVPSCTGNTYGNSSTGAGTTTSAAPTISPASGTFAGSQTVTITNSGTNRDVNTTDWCTTDGSTPTPGSGTALPYWNGGTLTVTATMTVKCVGMWGSLNQPYSHPSGYGYVPSSAVSETYTLSGGGTPTAATPTFSPASESFAVSASITISDSTPGSTIYYTTNGTTPTTSSAVYTSAIPVTATTTIEAIATASPYLDSAVGSGSYTLVAPTLSGVTLRLTGGATSVALGGTVQACANFTYTSPTENTTVCGSGTDAYGTAPSSYESSATTYATMNSTTGMLSGAAAGTTDITVMAGATQSVVGANTQNATLGVTTYQGWKSVCILTACNPGGTNAPASTTQTNNTTSPSLSGSSMELSETTLSSATTQTNALWVYLAGSCDECTTFKSDFWVYLASNITSNNNLEFDMFDFDVTDTLDFMWGTQCNLSTGQWQYANQTSGWTNSGVACSLTTSAWHHIQIANSRTGSTENFVSITIDGTLHAIGTTLPATSLPGGYASVVGYQSQLDIGAESGTTTATIYEDQASFQATNGFISPPLAVTVTSGAPTFASATVSLQGGGTTVNTGSAGQACINISYTSPTTNTQVCGSGTDAYGLGAAAFLSSATGIATITSPAGVITPVAAGSTNLTASVAGANVVSGTVTEDLVSTTAANNYEADYFVVGSNGLSPQTAQIYVGSGTSGDLIDIGITAATSPTTQASSALCYGTITESGLSNQLLTVSLSGCGYLAPGFTGWIWMNTNDPALAVGRQDCGGSCSGSSSSSTYGGCTNSLAYGTYTGMSTSFSGSCPGTYQRDQYVTSFPVSPTFSLTITTPSTPTTPVFSNMVSGPITIN